METHELYFSLLNLVEKEDLQGTKDFLINHLNEFPVKIKEDIAFQFFVEATNPDKNYILKVMKNQILVDLKKAIFDTLN